MRILAVSDEESESLWSGHVKDIARGVDIIVSCGDLRNEYLEFLLTMINVPLLYVFGNHDESGPEGGICIDGRVYEFEGVRFLGLGGSMRYRQGKNMYSESEMRWRYFRALPGIWRKGGIDILVTHAPAKGFGDLDDRAHRGFGIFNAIMRKYRPKYMLHGHVHKAYGRFRKEHIHDAGTVILNVCGYKIIETALKKRPTPTRS